MLGETFHVLSCVTGSFVRCGCAMTQGVKVVRESIVVGMVDGTRKVLSAAELDISFADVPAHTKGVGTYGSDEVPRQERPTPVAEVGEGQRKRRRRRGKRRGGRGGAPPS